MQNDEIRFIVKDDAVKFPLAIVLMKTGWKSPVNGI